MQLVYTTMPRMLCIQLKPLLRWPFERRFIVNVGVLERAARAGAAHRPDPHTNRTKAALNRRTRTSGADYAREGISMTRMDTGFTHENPRAVAERMAAAECTPPLDVDDGAARVYDPVVRGLNEPGVPTFGAFLKDEEPCS